MSIHDLQYWCHYGVSTSCLSSNSVMSLCILQNIAFDQIVFIRLYANKVAMKKTHTVYNNSIKANWKYIKSKPTIWYPPELLPISCELWSSTSSVPKSICTGPLLYWNMDGNPGYAVMAGKVKDEVEMTEDGEKVTWIDEVRCKYILMTIEDLLAPSCWAQYRSWF